MLATNAVVANQRAYVISGRDTPDPDGLLQTISTALQGVGWSEVLHSTPPGIDGADDEDVVVRWMKRSSWFHFSGHGMSDPTDHDRCYALGVDSASERPCNLADAPYPLWPTETEWGHWNYFTVHCHLMACSTAVGRPPDYWSGSIAEHALSKTGTRSVVGALRFVYFRHFDEWTSTFYGLAGATNPLTGKAYTISEATKKACEILDATIGEPTPDEHGFQLVDQDGDGTRETPGMKFAGSDAEMRPPR
jgi:hypothetical protein